MGWWGYGVMEGDGPLDMVCCIERAVLGYHAERDDDQQRVAELLQDPLMVKKAYDECAQYFGDHDPTDLQAFGHYVMTCGGPIDSFKDQLLKAIDDDLSHHWKDKDARVEAMATFRKQVVEYNTTPIVDTSKGLFEAMAIALHVS